VRGHYAGQKCFLPVIPIPAGSGGAKFQPAVNVYNTFNIETPNPDSFARSQSQIAAQAGTAILGAVRRLR
jgi:hypothetical protein